MRVGGCRLDGEGILKRELGWMKRVWCSCNSNRSDQLVRGGSMRAVQSFMDCYTLIGHISRN